MKRSRGGGAARRPSTEGTRPPRSARAPSARGRVALTHLLDTSVISRLGAKQVRAAIEPLAQAGRLGRAGITDLEVGYGCRSTREWDQDTADLAVFELVRPLPITLGGPGRCNACSRRAVGEDPSCRTSLLLPRPSSRLTLLHYDNDFELIAR